MRRRSALLFSSLSAALLVSLAACAPNASVPADGDCASSGAASDAVSVEGAFGSVPTIEFDGPLTSDVTQRTVLEQGEGDAAANGDTVVIEYTVLNGETGAELATTGFTGENAERFPIDTESQQLVGFSLLLDCATPGTRLAGVIPPAEGFGEQGVEELSLTGTESLVFVIDVVEIETSPEPVMPGEWTTGLPEIDLGSTPPVVTLPAGGAPDELLLAVLEQGDGDVVTAESTVLVDYQGTSWQTGEVFDQSYGASPATFPVSGVIPGFSAGLVGQQVGTTLIVSIPAELAYGVDPDAHPLGGQALLFLVSIIEIVS